MGQKLYEMSEEGGAGIIDKRKGWRGFIQTPNYIVDLWLPIIGHKAFTVYSTYCRLARDHEVKAIPQKTLANALRMGTGSLSAANKTLEECGFIKVIPPSKYQKSMHWTNCIKIYDPPVEVSAEIVEKYAHPQGYMPLSHWLVETSEEADKNDNVECEKPVEKGATTQMGSRNDNPNGYVDNPNGFSNIEDLNIEDLETEDLEKECAEARSILEEEKYNDETWMTMTNEEKVAAQRKRMERIERMRNEFHPGMPLDWVAGHILEVAADKDKVQQELEMEEKILASRLSAEQEFIVNMRSWMHVTYIEMAIQFFKSTGMKPISENERKAWVKAFDRMYKRGIIAADIKIAIEYMHDSGMVIKSPFSVETFANNQRDIRERYERQTFSKENR